MRKVLEHWLSYFKSNFDLRLYGATLLFLGVCIYVNYYTAPDGYRSWEYYIVQEYYVSKSVWCYFLYFGFYALPYLVILGFLAVRDPAVRKGLQQPSFWLRLLFIFAVLAIQASLGVQRYVNLQSFSSGDRYYYNRILGYLSPFLMIGLPIFLFWWFSDRKKGIPFMYGFTRRNFEFGPYLILLGLMLPLVAVASFWPSFQNFYPSLKLHRIQALSQLSPTVAFVLFEVLYGLYFVWAEVVFRGFLGIGMEKYLGQNAILPMVGPYAFRHFAKPPMESVSSIFGGFLLGILALRTRSVLGGAIVHAGIAVLMDICAFVQLSLK